MPALTAALIAVLVASPTPERALVPIAPSAVRNRDLLGLVDCGAGTSVCARLSRNKRPGYWPGHAVTKTGSLRIISAVPNRSGDNPFGS